MINFLNFLSGINIPFWVFAALSVAVILLVVFLIWFVRKRISKRPKAGIFETFIAASLHPRRRGSFFKWMRETGEEKAMRLLAESCRGEEFDRRFASAF